MGHRGIYCIHAWSLWRWISLMGSITFQPMPTGRLLRDQWMHSMTPAAGKKRSPSECLHSISFPGTAFCLLISAREANLICLAACTFSVC
jgi:hypothetical protein